MIRTLFLIAAVSFILTIGFFAGAFAVAGGPFYIDNHMRFHRDDVSEIDVQHRPPTFIEASASVN